MAIVTPINATVKAHTTVKQRKDGSNYISYLLQCADGRDRWKSLDADDFLPQGTTLRLVPYKDGKGREHHNFIDVERPQQQQWPRDEQAGLFLAEEKFWSLRSNCPTFDDWFVWDDKSVST